MSKLSATYVSSHGSKFIGATLLNELREYVIDYLKGKYEYLLHTFKLVISKKHIKPVITLEEGVLTVEISRLVIVVFMI